MKMLGVDLQMLFKTFLVATVRGVDNVIKDVYLDRVLVVGVNVLFGAGIGVAVGGGFGVEVEVVVLVQNDWELVLTKALSPEYVSEVRLP